MSAAPTPPNPLDARTQRRAAREQDRLRNLHQQSSSFLGPAILVALGVLFFLVELGHLSAGRLLPLVFRWSPLLLVILGVLRLVEWSLDRRRLQHARATGVPFQPTRFGPGFGLLLSVLLAFSFAGSVASRHHRDRFPDRLLLEQGQNWNQLFGERHESRDTIAYPCPAGSSLSIDLGHGDLTVSGTSSDGQIHVSTHTTIFSASETDAAQTARTVHPVFRSEGDHITLSAPTSQGAELDLDVTLPAPTSLTVNADHGDVALTHLNATATVTANHGDITLSDIQGSITARLNNSGSSIAAHQISGPASISGRFEDVTLSDATQAITIEGDIFGDLHLERLAGPLRLHTSRIDLEVASLAGSLQAEGGRDLSADQLTGPVVINTRNRNIALEALRGPVTINNQNGSISAALTEPLGPIEINNRHGQVTLELPPASSFTVDAQTTDADLTNSFGLNTTSADNHPQLQGSVGSGGPPVHIRTTQGDIIINKADHPPSVPGVPTPHPPPTPPHRPKDSALGSGEVTF